MGLKVKIDCSRKELGACVTHGGTRFVLRRNRIKNNMPAQPMILKHLGERPSLMNRAHGFIDGRALQAFRHDFFMDV